MRRRGYEAQLDARDGVLPARDGNEAAKKVYDEVNKTSKI
jgi:hypothetical protein